jgi:hypothetical protein
MRGTNLILHHIFAAAIEGRLTAQQTARRAGRLPAGNFPDGWQS